MQTIIVVLEKGEAMRLIDADAMEKRRIDYIVYGYAESVNDMTEWGMALVEAPTIGGWIPVTERLPEVGHIVLITAKSTLSDDFYVMWANVGKILNKGSLLDGIRFYTEQYGDINEQHGFKVVAWQPLPEPYKEGTDE